MNFPSIRIEGAILSPDILERIEELPGQKPGDFGLDASARVKDEIARAWADAQDYWRIFQRRLETIKAETPATSETRQQWIVPLLGLLGYQLEYQARGAELNGKSYAISHRAVNRAQTPVQIVGFREPAGLDRKPERAPLRMSAHALVQEYINLTEQLYAIVTNGRILRLLRDSSRLIKLSYLEFDLDRIFTDGLFADFAILYRLLHASRLPVAPDAAAESLIERYHQDSLESGARIRDGLSAAVEQAILDFGNGFLAHPANEALRAAVAAGTLAPRQYYQNLLRLIYRLLFLMVIEERGLVFPLAATAKQREIYRRCYSVQRLRLLAEKRHLADRRRHDLWLALTATFRLFEAGGPGAKLGLAPLAGELFRHDATGSLAECTLGNDVLLGCLRSLGLYEHPDTRQLIRVNYAALNVEEFGSVYQGLLEYEPVFLSDTPLASSRPEGEGTGGRAPSFTFAFQAGDERGDTGSHYTPEELVQPLIRHSLDYLIAERLKTANPEAALLDLRVADISCGSGHILLAAARRIATELAIVRTGEDQPSPTAYRVALRDVIRTCIYGVDLNPLAVELCKVALWLEAHNPGQPLNFLDHHIKCGNAIVGSVRREEIDKGVPDEAFATMPGDEKEIAARWRKRNKEERKAQAQVAMQFSPEIRGHLDALLTQWNTLSALPERTPEEIDAKKARFVAFAEGRDAYLLNQIAAIPIAQFYVPKTAANDQKLIADEQFRRYWPGGQTPQGQATALAWATAHEKRFFHWFLEFPDIFSPRPAGEGSGVRAPGFDCVLGNPPYLGGHGLTGTYGHPFCEYVRWEYAPAGLSDLVVYFVRRIYSLLRPDGFTAFITTNSIKDGDIRKDGLEQVLGQGGEITMAVRGIKWPGRANLVVSLVALHKGAWSGKRVLDGHEVPMISAHFEETPDGGDPINLPENAARIFQGSIFLGDGFLLTHDEAERLTHADPRNVEVVFAVINGQEINNEPDQKPGRSIINFHNWDLEQAATYPAPFEVVERLVKPSRDALPNNPRNLGAKRNWWQFIWSRPELYRRVRPLPHCFVAAATTKYLNFSAAPTNIVFTHALYVLTTDRWDLYAVVQSTLHEVWARKYSGALKQDLRYSPSKCFETFAFPDGLWQTADPVLAAIGERYHEHRKSLMLSLWLGLTDIYNLFHARDLEQRAGQLFKKRAATSPWRAAVPEEHRAAVGAMTPARALDGIHRLRELHRDLDNAVLAAYGWAGQTVNGRTADRVIPNGEMASSETAKGEIDLPPISLNHDFVEVETLAENDRVRLTISPAARTELLRRLLALNHARTAAESAPNLAKPTKRTRTPKKTEPAGGLFS